MKSIHFKTVLVFFALLIGACGDRAKKEENKSQSGLRVEASLVKPAVLNQNLSVTADILPVEQIELMAPLQGQVTAILFKEGQFISKGQSILRLDDRIWKAQIPGLKANLEMAENNLRRKKELLKIGGSSQEEIDQAYAEAESLKSQIQLLEVNIDLAHIRAPFDAYIGMRNISVGSYLKQGDMITTLTSKSSLKVNFTVPQLQQYSIETGKSIDVIIGGDTFSAGIYAVSPIVQAENRSLQVRALLSPGKNAHILPGTYAEVLIKTSLDRAAILVPSQAVVPGLNEQTVYLYRNGKAVRQVVQLGVRTADQVHIAEGLKSGDTLICTGLLQIKPGMDISILKFQ